MQTCKIPHTDLLVSRLAYGCAGLIAWNKDEVSAGDIAKAARVVNTAYDNGITFFDHADIYAFGKSEMVFGEVLKQSPGLRDKLVIQSKCGQRLPDGWQRGDPIRADLSREHIVSSVEGSLKRLRTDRLDILLLHLPDALVEPQEVAQAFDELSSSGKVRYFGVSNHTAAHIQKLQKSVRQPIVANQIHLGLAHAFAFTDGMEFTLQMANGATADRGYMGIAGTGTMDYCCVHDIQLQAWSPLRSALLNPAANSSPELTRTAQLLVDLAQQKQTTASVIALAWLLRHPAGIVPIMGAGNPDHIIENCAADGVKLSREEWYDLLAAAAPVQARSI